MDVSFLVLWYFGFMVLWFYGFMVLRVCGFTVLWFCGFGVRRFGRAGGLGTEGAILKSVQQYLYLTATGFPDTY